MGTAEGFNAGLAWHETQRNPLGMRYTINRRTWEYIEVKDTWGVGELVESESTRDVTSESDDDVAVATATAVGGDTLIAAASTFTDEEIVGAVGMITAGGAIGTSFQVLERVSATTIRIRVISTLSDGRSTTGKLAAATTTATRFTLELPGKVVKAQAGHATNPTKRPSGFAQRAAVSGDKGKFGFVLARGLGMGKLDASEDDNLTIGGPLVKATTAGLVAAAAATKVNLIIAYSIGSAMGGSDGVVLVDAQCPDHYYQDLLPYLENAYNLVTIG